MKKRFLFSLLFSLAVALLSLCLFNGFSVMGVANREIQNYVLSHFKGYILLYQFYILLGYLGVALVMTLWTSLLKLEKAWEILLFNLVIWLFFWLRAVKVHPQVFVEALFSHPGWRRSLQLFLTDTLPLWTLFSLFFLYIALLIFRSRRYTGGMVVALTLLFILIPSKRGNFKGSVRQGPPNLIILASDSLRPDHISYNGYPRKTPNIDRIFSQGGNFTHMVSSLARTFPSWTSILTSQYPPEHGIRHMFPTIEERRPHRVTLSSWLRWKGYYTAVIGDFAADMFPRMDFGFERTSAPDFTAKTLIQQRSLEVHHFLLGFLLTPHGRDLYPVIYEMAQAQDPYRLAEKTKGHINRALKEQRPFFILTFFSCSHFPYSPSFPYYGVYSDPHYKGAHKYKKENLLAEYTGASISTADREQLIALYDGGIRQFDDTVGDIQAFLEKGKLLDNTVVVVMSDHGENLYESSYGMGHGDHLRGPYGNRMTFGVRDPKRGFKGIRVKAVVRDIDIAPTLLELLNQPRPPSFRGETLVPFLQGAPGDGFPAYSETGIWYTRNIPSIPKGVRLDYPDITELMEADKLTDEIVLKDKYRAQVINAKHRALETDGYKWIYMPGPEGARYELYKQDQPMVPELDIGREVNPFFLENFKNLLQRTFSKRFIPYGGHFLERGVFPDSPQVRMPELPFSRDEGAQKVQR